MSSRLADKLLSFRSEEEFLTTLAGRADWRTVARLKLDVDHLIGTDVKRAARVVDSVEKLASVLGDKVSDAYARISRARLLYTQGQHLKANDLYTAGVKALHGAGLRTEAAMVQVQQIDTLKFLGRYDDAIQTAKTARRHLAKAGNVPLAQLETNLGNVYFHLDRYKVALQHYDKARAMLSRAGGPTMRGLVDFCRSCVYIEIDQPERALKVLDSASRAHEAAGKTLTSAQVRCQAAYIDFLRGNFNSALATYYGVRDRLIELGSEQDIAFYSLELAEVLLALNAFEDSAENGEKARDGFSGLGMSYELGKSLQLLGLAKMGLQEYDTARDCLVRARRIFHKSGNGTFVALTDSYLAELALRRGKSREAAERAEAAYRVFSRQKLANRSAQSRLQAAGAALKLGDETRALRFARAALKTVEGLFAPGITYKCHHLIGQVHAKRSDSKAALESLRRSVDIIEELRGGIAADEFKGSFLRDKIEVYEDAIRLCLDSDDEKLVEEAFRLVELSKSRALADLVARYLRSGEAGKKANTQGPGGQTRAHLLKLIEDLNWYSSNAGIEDDKGGQRSALTVDRYQRAVARCERQIAQLFRRLEAEGSSFSEAQTARAVTGEELRISLAQDESVLEYFMAGDEVCAFVATSSGMKLLRRVAEKSEVERLLAAMRFQTEKFNYGSAYVESHFGQLMRSALDHLAAIYECVFKPIESEIRTPKIIVIPHGQLHYLPFHALYTGRDYLIDKFEISYAPSASILRLCRRRKHTSSGSKLLALGVSEHDTPGINAEMAALEQVFPDSERFSGDEATLANLLAHAPGARFLHLASHGGFRRDNPMFSFLKLADSRLNFYSLLDLKLNAELVTLSACRTGVNAVSPGDELHGLMRGFLYAGAPALVVSLWAVSDRSTAELMRRMYGGLRIGKNKGAALREAQLAVKESYGHPYYWAPFILMGNPN